MAHYSVVLFDVDGTLLNTTPGVVASVQYTIEQLALAALPESVLKRFAGPPIQDSFIRAYGMTPAEAQQAANIFRTHYKEKTLLLAKPYEGVLSLLSALKERGMRIGVATYKRADYATRILGHFGIAKLCDYISGADNEGLLQKSDIIDICLKNLEVNDKASAIFIGDSFYDAKGAQESGVEFVGVTYGFGFHSASDISPYPYRACIDKPLDLMNVLF